MRILKEKDLLKLMTDGPTLELLTKRISGEFREEISSGSVGDVLPALEKNGYVFREAGRW